MPTTLLSVEPAGPGRDGAAPRVEPVEAAAQEAARAIELGDPDRERTKPEKVDVTTRPRTGAANRVVESEARKGYDLLVIGTCPTTSLNIDDGVLHIADAFEGPIAIVVGRGRLSSGSPTKILVPVNGADVSARAAELAVVLSRASGARLTALHVSAPESGRRLRLGATALAYQETVLEDIVTVADQYGAAIRTRSRVARQVQTAILQEAHGQGDTLVVLGVSRRRARAPFFFGEVATAVLERGRVFGTAGSDLNRLHGCCATGAALP